MHIIVSIPAYNEEKTLAQVIKDIKQAMKDTGHSFDIVVVDDGSTDATVHIAEKAGAKVYSNKRNLGLAETFKHEMEVCSKHKADIIVHTDADGQYPAEYIPQMIAEIKKGADLVLGSRFGKGKYSGPLMNRIGNKVFAMLFSRLLHAKITDTTTGFRAFRPEVARLQLIGNFTYTQEQLIRAYKEHMKIVEVPIIAQKTRKSRLFSNPFNYAARAWINLFRIYRDFAPLRFFGSIGAVFLILGAGLGIWIIQTLLATGAVGGIPRVILSAVLILAGVQIILFGFLADMLQK